MASPAPAPAAVAIRRAAPADALDIARVHVQAWHEAYAALLPAHVIASMTLAYRAAHWRASFALGGDIAEGRTAAWVAVEVAPGRAGRRAGEAGHGTDINDDDDDDDGNDRDSDSDNGGSDRVVGFATAGAVRHSADAAALSSAAAAPDPATSPPRELCSLYLLAAHHGTGVAARLLYAAMPGPGPAVLWMLATNARARAFYARHAFAPDPALGGTRTDYCAGEPLAVVRMLRP